MPALLTSIPVCRRSSHEHDGVRALPTWTPTCCALFLQAGLLEEAVSISEEVALAEDEQRVLDEGRGVRRAEVGAAQAAVEVGVELVAELEQSAVDAARDEDLG